MKTPSGSLERLALALLAALAGGGALALGARVRGMDVALAAPRALCPIEVVVDEDARRSPRRIKLLRCAAAGAPCCGAAACVELLDQVLVAYAGRAPAPTPVPVGCACLPPPAPQPALED